MKVVVPFVDDVTCQRNHYGEIAPSMVCYGEAGKDSCHGGIFILVKGKVEFGLIWAYVFLFCLI